MQVHGSTTTDATSRYPGVAAVKQLPVRVRRVVTPDYLDYNRHMNVRHYFDLHLVTFESLWDDFGIAEAYHASGQGTVFTLEQQLVYLAEVKAGDELTTHVRAVARTAKVVSMVSFIVNETTSQLSGVMHMLGGHIDLETRRMSEFPPEPSGRIDAMLEQHGRLDWPAPLSSATAVRL